MRPESCTPFHSLLISSRRSRDWEERWALLQASYVILSKPFVVFSFSLLENQGPQVGVGSGTWRGQGTTSKRIIQPKDRTWTHFSSVISHVQLFATPWTAACQASLSITNYWSLLRLIVHRVGDAIRPFHPLLSPSPPTFNLSQNQGIFQWVSSSHQVAKVLEFQLQHQSFQWIFKTDFP